MREGLMDDTGYRGFDDGEEFFEKYCSRCVNLPIEERNGEIYALDCKKDCTLSCPRFFEEGE